MSLSLRHRQEWQFFGALFRAAPASRPSWWLLLLLRGLLPAVIASRDRRPDRRGARRHGSLAGPLTVVGIVFVLFQVLTPLHLAVSANLGSRTAAWLNDRLMVACDRAGRASRTSSARPHQRPHDGARLRPRHHRPAARRSAWTSSRAGSSRWSAGSAAAVLLFRFAWWAPLLLVGAWVSTHWLLRESGVWRTATPTRCAPRSATPSTRTGSRSTRPRRRSCACSGSPTG